MKSFWIASIGIAVAAVCVSGSVSLHRDRLHTFQRENVLGTSFELKVVAPTAEAAARAETAALDEIGRDAAILSSWDAQSEFSRWFRTRNQPVPVSPELLEVLGLFDSW